MKLVFSTLPESMFNCSFCYCEILGLGPTFKSFRNLLKISYKRFEDFTGVLSAPKAFLLLPFCIDQEIISFSGAILQFLVKVFWWSTFIHHSFRGTSMLASDHALTL